MTVTYTGLTRQTWPGTWSPSSNHPIALDTELRGTLQSITGDATDRLANINGLRIAEGMMVFVKNTYTSGGVTISGNSYYTYRQQSGDFRGLDGYLPNDEATNWIQVTPTTFGSINVTSGYSDANVYSNVTLIGFATNANINLKANVADLTTANIAETDNLYFTNARVYANVITLIANSSNGLTTTGVAEGTNLYYSNARVLGNLASTSNIIVGSLIPATPGSTLGNSTHRWGTIFVAADTISLGNVFLKSDGGTFLVTSTPTSNVSLIPSFEDIVTDTGNVTETTNLYFTNARVREAITISGAATYNNATGTINVTGDFSNTTITHAGLIMTEGTIPNVDQLKIITKSLVLTEDWQDTGIKYNDLATGTYIIQVYANDGNAGGYNNDEYYSGTMSWWAGNTESSVELPSDEIALHRAGRSSEAGLYLRSFRSPSGNVDRLRLQIYSNTATNSPSNYVFKFRRMI